MADRVRLRHPETGGEWDCPAAAVDGWKELGWEEVSTASLKSKSKPQLEEIAAQRGVDLSGAKNNDERVALLEG